jgi:anti-sigma factor RsiW
MMTLPLSERSQDWRALVHAYLDGELSVSESLEIERAIAMSDELAAEAAGVRALKQALSSRLPPETLPPQLIARITNQVGLRAVQKRPTWLALAASVLLAMGLSGIITAHVYRDIDYRIYTESVDSHLRSLMASAPVDVVSTERHIVKPWFNGKSVQAPKVADLAAEGFPLVGGRIDVMQGSPLPTLVYKRRLHTISVWVATEALSARLTRNTHSVNGTNVVVWRAADMAYWAVSDLNAVELSKFAQLFAAAP